jgi:hypothetical protein
METVSMARPTPTMSTYANEASFRVGATKRRLSVDSRSQVGRICDLFEFGHRPTPNGQQLWRIGVRRCAGRPCFPVVHSIQLRSRTLRVEVLGAHVRLYGR